MKRERWWTSCWIVSVLAFLPGLVLLHGKAGQEAQEAVRLTDETRNLVERMLRQLTVEEKVGQLLQVRYSVDYKGLDSSEYRQLRSELQKYHIGSVVFGMHVAKSGARVRVLLWMPPTLPTNCSATRSCPCSSPPISSAESPRADGVETLTVTYPDATWTAGP